MTAEQALIEENKKDPIKKYITKDINGNTEFWSAKPFINHETGQWMAEGFLISIVLNDIEIDFSRKDWQECILCIDDIKQEIPPIPEKWYIECTEDNRDILNSWRLKKCDDFYKDDKHLLPNEILLSQNPYDESFYYSNDIQFFKDSVCFKDYQEITLEQFKKYVLCEGEEKQEEKEFIEKRKAIRESMKSFGRIISTDINGNPFPEPTNNSSFEFYSTRCWIEDRINYINKFIRQNIDSDLCIPIEWVNQRNELVEKLKNL